MRSIAAVLTCSILGGVALAQSTEIVSVSSGGTPAGQDCQWPSISPDGRYVVFMSAGNNLVPGDTGQTDVFLHDRHTNETSRLSDSFAGGQPSASSQTAGVFGNAGGSAFSADNRYVVFLSQANNLVPSDTNNAQDVFVRDLQTGTTSRVSIATDGTPGNFNSVSAAISANGRYVAFASGATNLVFGDTNERSDVFVHDRSTGETTRVSVNSSGAQALQHSWQPAISGDGRYVAFMSEGYFMAPNDTNKVADVFVHDRQTGSTKRVSVDSSGGEGNNSSQQPQISADGRYIAFVTNATNLTPEGIAGILVHDRQTATTTFASRASNGTPAYGEFPSMSPDGRFVAFRSAASLVPADTNGAPDAYVRDRWLGTTVRVSVASDGAQVDEGSLSPEIAADGRYAAFGSVATTLVPVATNGKQQIYVRDAGPGPITPFCFGDGSLAACPCANSGTAEHGCASSIYADGGYLRGFGVPSVASDSVLLRAQEMSGNVCVFFQGNAQMSPTVIDDGLGCVSGTILRLGTKTVVDAAAEYPTGADLSVSVKGLVGPAGGERFYQAFYRNAAPSFCPSATTNRTNGLRIVWSP